MVDQYAGRYLGFINPTVYLVLGVAQANASCEVTSRPRCRPLYASACPRLPALARTARVAPSRGLQLSPRLRAAPFEARRTGLACCGL